MKKLFLASLVLLGTAVWGLKWYSSWDAQQEADAYLAHFLAAKGQWSRSGDIPFWHGSVRFCVYGKEPNSVVRRELDAIVRAFRRISENRVQIEYVRSIDQCSTQTLIFVWVQEGDVFRKDVVANYQAIVRLKGLEVDYLDPHFYESAYAQTAFLIDDQDVGVALLLNQIGPEPTALAARFIRANVQEEMFQAYAVAADLLVNGDEQRSILEETFVETKSLWGGVYSPDDVRHYLETRPNGLCLWDAITLLLLYSNPETGTDRREFKRRILAEYDQFKADAIALSITPELQPVFDLECGNSNEVSVQ